MGGIAARFFFANFNLILEVIKKISAMDKNNSNNNSCTTSKSENALVSEDIESDNNLLGSANIISKESVSEKSVHAPIDKKELNADKLRNLGMKKKQDSDSDSDKQNDSSNNSNNSINHKIIDLNNDSCISARKDIIKNIPCENTNTNKKFSETYINQEKLPLHNPVNSNFSTTTAIDVDDSGKGDEFLSMDPKTTSSRHRRSHRTSSHSRSASYECKGKRRSMSNDREYLRSRRSISLERRRKERKRRHAEQNERNEHKGTSESYNYKDKYDRRRCEEKEIGLHKKLSADRDLDNVTEASLKSKITERQRRTVDLLTSRTGGAYIPPAKLRLLQAEITDKTSAAYQRIAWEALKKSIHGYINKVNVDNIAIITRELLKENIVRGRGLLCRSITQAQAASPTFTHVYAALVAIINSKFPNIGELLLKRLIVQFKRAFRRNDKIASLSSTRFIAHLINQRVAHEILALEILTILVETPTDDSVEVAIAFLKESGMKLTEVSSKGIGAIFEMLRHILHEGTLDKRVQYMIEVVFQIRKDGFKDHQSVIEALELVEDDDQFTHMLMLSDATDTEDILNAFKFDEQYEVNENKYKNLSRDILGSDAFDSEKTSGMSDSRSESTSSSESEVDENEENSNVVVDNTESNLIALRRTIYLTINSSLDYEECAHKLMKMQLQPGQEIELCHMFLDCCAEQRTYEKFYGLLAQRFCNINKIFIEPFEEIFADTYQTTHRLDTNRLRNVSKFFAHLLFTDAISWDVLECIKLNEDDTTSSSRIFIKILFQELAEYMGLTKLNKKLKDEILVESLVGLFPKDNPRNTRFSINFFTSIGLGGLTDELRQFLKNAPKSVPAINAEILANQPIQTMSSSSSCSSSSLSSSNESTYSTSTSTTSQGSSHSNIELRTDRKHKQVDQNQKKIVRKSKNISRKERNYNDNIDKKRNKYKRKHNSSSDSESESLSVISHSSGNSTSNSDSISHNIENTQNHKKKNTSKSESQHLQNKKSEQIESNKSIQKSKHIDNSCKNDYDNTKYKRNKEKSQKIYENQQECKTKNDDLKKRKRDVQEFQRGETIEDNEDYQKELYKKHKKDSVRKVESDRNNKDQHEKEKKDLQNFEKHVKRNNRSSMPLEQEVRDKNQSEKSPNYRRKEYSHSHRHSRSLSRRHSRNRNHRSQSRNRRDSNSCSNRRSRSRNRQHNKNRSDRRSRSRRRSSIHKHSYIRLHIRNKDHSYSGRCKNSRSRS